MRNRTPNSIGVSTERSPVAEIELHFCNEPLVETADHIEIPPTAESYVDVPNLNEAVSVLAVIVAQSGEWKAGYVELDGMFFFGVTWVGTDYIRLIHTPAADAFFDEHFPGWRFGLFGPTSLN